MQLLSTIALIATAVHCAQAAPERKLLRTGVGSDLDFSALNDPTAGDSTAALSSITSLLPTSGGTSAILPNTGTDSLASLTTESSGLAGLTSMTGVNGLSSLSVPTGSATGIGSISNLLDTTTESSTSETLLPSTSKGKEPSTASATATTNTTTQGSSEASGGR